jgi:hypothetical protein
VSGNPDKNCEQESYGGNYGLLNKNFIQTDFCVLVGNTLLVYSREENWPEKSDHGSHRHREGTRCHPNSSLVFKGGIGGINFTFSSLNQSVMNFAWQLLMVGIEIPINI